MITYPKGYEICWRSDIPPRPGAQTGVLAQPWRRYETFPVVLWDGESEPHQALPECVTIAPLSPAQLATTSARNAWDEYKPARRAGR